MKRRITLTLFFIIYFLINMALAPTLNISPTSCQDSDGDCDVSRINITDDVYEIVDLLTFPFGYLIANGFTNSIAEEDSIDSAYIHILWFTDIDLGATDINVDYWDGSSWINCAGPFEENDTLTETVCNVSHLTKDQISNLQVRIRGKDIDGFPMAFLYVDSIFVKINHSGPPKWRNQTTNVTTNFIYSMEPIRLSVEAFDDVGLSYAWISTNETGEWKNYTDGTYGSPIALNGLANTWTWINFTWKNDTFLSGSVAWKIYINDTTGKEISTEEKMFYVQFRMLPTSCQDSDGDCDVSRINITDDVHEIVDLLTFPFGYIKAYNWDLKLPDNSLVRSAYIHILWFTDVDLGATDINVDYWDGSSWINCAGPFEENDTLTETVCNVSHLTKDQISNLQVRIRGKDIDGFPMAFLYVDSIFILINYTIGIPYLEVKLITPNPFLTNYIVQNSTFIVNATVYCRVDKCDNVYGVLLYNLTSLYPDTPVNTSYGDIPLFVDEIPPISMKACPNNPLKEGMFCNLSWIVNVSGDLFTEWKIGVYFNSSLNLVRPNSTENATIYILPCPIDFTISWDFIDFGELVPNTYGNPAIGNSLGIYNISVNPGSCNLDFYIRGEDLYNQKTNSYIAVGNISFSNSTNSYSNSFRLKKTYQHLFINVTQGEYTTYYWIDIPPTYAGTYTSKIFIKGVYSGLLP